MIVITGAAGFIGSYLAGHLNEQGYNDLVLVDDFSRKDKEHNWKQKTFTSKVDRTQFSEWIRDNHKLVQFIFHMGARTDTSEQDEMLFDQLNLNYSKKVWKVCCEYGIPLVYASSAATYGDGSLGYSDDHNLPAKLQPMNPYGRSKNNFDIWALNQTEKPRFWAGLKFFNVYGPNEYHKGRMASVVFHAFNQIRDHGKVKLFRSHRDDFADGKQQRDFIYVRDVASVCTFLMQNRNPENNGLYNLGTGRAETFLELAGSLFEALGKESHIEFIDIPEDIRDTYQYYTCANMEKLRKAGYRENFYPLRKGVYDYVSKYLSAGSYY